MTNERSLFKFLFGLLAAISLSLACVLIFSWIVQITGLTSNYIKPINQVIKIICVVVGSFIAISPPKGGLKGLLFGLVYILITNGIFALISGGFTFDIGVLWELLFGTAVGLICGVCVVNLKR